jgi:pimeloyl-ACP methyl ester carboxylesterase
MQRRAFEQQLPVWELADDELLTEGLDERLGDVAAPTLVLAGEEDVDDIDEIAARLAAGIPDARRATIPGAAHLPSLERPEEFDRLVLGFLAGQEP